MGGGGIKETNQLMDDDDDDDDDNDSHHASRKQRVEELRWPGYIPIHGNNIAIVIIVIVNR